MQETNKIGEFVYKTILAHQSILTDVWYHRFNVCETRFGQLYTLVQQKPKVFELLIGIVHDACSSNRSQLIFDPLPPGMSVSTVKEIVTKMPSLEDLKRCSSENNIEETLGEK